VSGAAALQRLQTSWILFGVIMTPAEIRDIIHSARDAWITGDADAFANLFTPDGEFMVPGDQWVGPAAIRNSVMEFIDRYTDVKITIHRILVNDPQNAPQNGQCDRPDYQYQAVVEWDWEDTDSSTGHRNYAQDAIVIDFRGTQITRWREYIDAESRLNQG
jgi:uncharacterized protein (TIGR02246 family)